MDIGDLWEAIIAAATIAGVVAQVYQNKILHKANTLTEMSQAHKEQGDGGKMRPPAPILPRYKQYWPTIGIALMLLGTLAYNVYEHHFALAYNSHPTFQEVKGRTFVNEVVPLDGMAYEDCTFTNVTFKYDGRSAFRLAHNNIVGEVLLTTDNPAVLGGLVAAKGLRLIPENVPFLDQRGRFDYQR